MKYAFIERHKLVWPIRVRCRVLLPSVSGCHRHLARRLPRRLGFARLASAPCGRPPRRVRARVVRRWLAENANKIEVFYLPRNAPDLNPDELRDVGPKTTSHSGCSGKNATTTRQGHIQGSAQHPKTAGQRTTLRPSPGAEICRLSAILSGRINIGKVDADEVKGGKLAAAHAAMASSQVGWSLLMIDAKSPFTPSVRGARERDETSLRPAVWRRFWRSR